MKSFLLLFVFAFHVSAAEISFNGIVWTLETVPAASGTFVTGDPWVVGPVKITGIKYTQHDPNYPPRVGQDGSMLNPAGTIYQGYDDGLSDYKAELNAGLPQGKPVSPSNPLDLPTGSSLVTMASWTYKSPEDREPQSPKWDTIAKTPRPAVRAAAILTVLEKAPPAGSFRPPYSGPEKSVKFNISQLDYSKLPKVKPVSSAPTLESLTDAMAKPWVDHVNTWIGGHLHPSSQMPPYGRDLARTVATCILASFLSDAPAGQNPACDKVIQNLVQFGIDCTGIADAGGFWPADGGHGLGRKLPILYAGVLLDDPHMKDVGEWTTRFQENEQTFYVSQAEVDMTNGPDWKPDKRVKMTPYTAADIGTPEWGIGHVKNPAGDNKAWEANYREVNGAVIPAFALAARLMNLKEAWNHDAFFAYCDRYMKWYLEEKPKLANVPSLFFIEMWQTYRQPPAPNP